MKKWHGQRQDDCLYISVEIDLGLMAILFTNKEAQQLVEFGFHLPFWFCDITLNTSGFEFRKFAYNLPTSFPAIGAISLRNIISGITSFSNPESIF